MRRSRPSRTCLKVVVALSAAISACSGPGVEPPQATAAPSTAAPAPTTEAAPTTSLVPASSLPSPMPTVDLGPTTTGGAPASVEPTWSEEFNGDRLNPEVWGHESPFYGASHGGVQIYEPGAATVEDGLLVITASRRADELLVDDDDDGTADRSLSWTSAFVTTKDRIDVGYGRLEARVRLPEGQGLWSAVWLRPSARAYGSWPKSGEIDLVEALGHEPHQAHTTVHWWNMGHVFEPLAHPLHPTEDGFHVFALESTPGQLIWSIDGVVVHEFRDWPSVHTPPPAPFDQRFFVNVNLAVGGNWPGAPDATTPDGARLEVDWIRFYAYEDQHTESVDR